MSCRDYQTLIEKVRDGQTDETELAALEAHAAACPACREALDALESLRGLVTKALRAETPTAEARDAILSELPDRPTSASDRNAAGRPQILRWRMPVAACVLLALGMLLGYGIGQDAPPASSAGDRGAPVPIQVADVDGTVLVKHRGSSVWEELTGTSKLYLGDVYHASAGSAMTLSLGDDAKVRLDANGTLSLQSYGDRVELDLDYGKMTAALNGPHPPFFVVTPQGRIEALGTEFAVSVK